MLLLLVPATIVLLFIQFYHLSRHAVTAGIQALIGAYFWTWLSTEAISTLNGINQTNLALSWMLLLTPLAWMWWRQGFSAKGFRVQKAPKYPFQLFIALALLVTLGLCFLAYPNNWDSMTYHLARMMHWKQEGSVGHYATHIQRQISQPPLAEYAMMHAWLLGGFDRAANLVQWSAFAGSLLVVYGIVRQCGGNPKTGWLAALLLAALPMGLMQATSTQNDFIAAFFLAASVYFLLLFKQADKQTIYLIFFTTSIALAIQTKGTHYIYVLPICIVFCILILKRKLYTKFILYFSALIILVINAPHAYRNYITFGDFTGKDTTLINTPISVEALWSNSLRQLAAESATPITPFNKGVEQTVATVHHLAGIELNNPNTTWLYSPPFQVGPFIPHEDYAQAPFHLLLFLLFTWWLFRHRKSHSLLVIGWLVVVAMGLLLSVIFKWQVWHNRLHLSLWVLLIPLIAMWLGKTDAWWQSTVITFLSLSMIPLLLYNYSRPLIGPNSVLLRYSFHQYFLNREELLRPYLDMCAIIEREDMKQLGLVLSGDSWEYPFWVIADPSTKWKHILVDNPSQIFENDELPEGIISHRSLHEQDNRFTYLQATYRLSYQNGSWHFYERTVNRETPIPK